MVINPIKTKAMTIATRQKHQLSPLPLDLALNGEKIYPVSENRLLGITIDSKLRWDSHINNVCKTVSSRLLSVEIKVHRIHRTRILFFNAHIKPHIDYASVVVMASKRDYIFSAQKSCKVNLSRYNYNY